MGDDVVEVELSWTWVEPQPHLRNPGGRSRAPADMQWHSSACLEKGEGAIATRKPPCEVRLVALELDQCGNIGNSEFADLVRRVAPDSGRRFEILLEEHERSPLHPTVQRALDESEHPNRWCLLQVWREAGLDFLHLH